METEKQNQGEGWYQGQLKKSGKEYLLETEERELEVPESELAEQAWHDLRNEPQEVMLYGELSVQEAITGGETYSLKNPSKAGYILDEDYDGKKVLLSGYDLVFIEDGEEITYEAENHEDMRDNLKGWFDDEKEKEVLDTLVDLKLEKEYWPWEDQA